MSKRDRSNTVKEAGGNVLLEIVIRAILALIFVELEGATPFQRKIQPEELWLYKYPRTESYVPTTILWPLVFGTPTLIVFIVFLIQKNKLDVSQAILSFSLALALNGVITDIIKIFVGRPRPDFYWRCFPDGLLNDDFKCTGEESVVLDGRKSFPSGHASFSFASMGFISFYLAGKLHVFTSLGRGNSWRLSAVLMPLLVALSIAISRTCDYHHHWQDVLCGSILGLSLSYLCYRQYYPSLTSLQCHRSYIEITPYIELDSVQTNQEPTKVEEQIKWI